MTKRKKPAQNSGKTAKEPRGRPFRSGESGNPGGRPRMPEDLKTALAADSIEVYQEAKELYADCLETGDLSTAAKVIIALMKKSIPDTQHLLVSNPEGKPLSVNLDPTKLTTAELDVVIQAQAIIARQRNEAKPPEEQAH